MKIQKWQIQIKVLSLSLPNRSKFLEGKGTNSHLQFGLVNKWIGPYGSNSGKTKSNELVFLIWIEWLLDLIRR